MEEWRKIPSLEGYYASSLGRIKSTRQRRFQNIGEHILVQHTCDEGYKRVRGIEKICINQNVAKLQI